MTTDRAARPSNARTGFSLIELMIVIAIIGILVAVALPQFLSVTEDAKHTKARQDCDIICQAIQKYNALEGCQIESLTDLKGKYLTGIDTLRDPWGNAYRIDVFGGTVYSKGPDGQDKMNAADPANPSLDNAAQVNKDNVKVPYIGALTIVKATLEVNPTGKADPAEAFDVLHLFFNKRVKVAGGSINLASVAGAAPTEIQAAGKAPDDVTGAFRWCSGSRNNYVANPIGTTADDSMFKKAVDNTGAMGAAAAEDVTSADAGTLWDGTPTAGRHYFKADHREIVIALGAGTSGSIIPGTHFINLTGNRKNEDPTNAADRNPTFKEFNGLTGAEMSGTPIQIMVGD